MMNRTQYLLVKVAEEAIETAQRATKGVTFGLDQRQEGQPLSNRERLYYEYNDLIAMLRLLNLPTEPNEEKIALKMEKLKKFMALSVALGELELQPDLVGIELPEPVNRVEKPKHAFVSNIKDCPACQVAADAIFEAAPEHDPEGEAAMVKILHKTHVQAPADGCKFHTADDKPIFIPTSAVPHS